MALGIGADPDLCPGRWDDQRFDALQQVRLFDDLSCRMQVPKTLARALAPDSGTVIGDVMETDYFGGLGRIGLSFRRHDALRAAGWVAGWAPECSRETATSSVCLRLHANSSAARDGCRCLISSTSRSVRMAATIFKSGNSARIFR